MRAAPVLIGLLVLATPAFAQAPPDSPRTAAEKVVAAVEEGDTGDLAALASRAKPDPWLVVEELLRMERRDAALAFATAAPCPDTKKLPDYVRGAPTGEVDAKARSALDRAWVELRQRKGAEGLARLEGVEAGGLLGIQIEWARGLALMVAKRPEESIAALKRGAAGAERIGWLSVASSFYNKAGTVAYEGSSFDVARSCWEDHLRVEEARENPTGVMGALCNLGIIHEIQGRLDEARKNYERAVEIARKEGDRRGEAFVLGNLGVLHSKREEFDEALECYGRSLALSRELGDLRGVVDSLANRGIVHDQRGDYFAAIRSHEQALENARELGDPRRLASVFSNLGRAYHEIGDSPKALELQERALALRRKIGDRAGTAVSLGSVAAVCSGMGELSRALGLQEEALALARQVGDPFAEAVTLLNLSVLNAKLGNYPRSIALAGRARAAYEKLGSLRGVAQVLTQQADLRRVLGESGAAIELLTEAARIQEKIGDAHGRLTTLIQLSSAWRAQGDEARSETLLDEALEKSREAKLRREECLCLHQLAELAMHRGDRDREIELRTRTLEIYRSAGHRLGMADELSALAAANAVGGDLDEAARQQKEAEELLRESGCPPKLVTCLGTRAGVEYRRKEHAEASATVREALELLSGELGGLSDEEGAALREGRAAVYEMGVLAAVAADDAAELCHVLESGRAGALLESLGARARLREDLIPEELRRREAVARAALTRATAEYDRARAAGSRKEQGERRAALDAAREEVRATVREIQRTAKAAAGLVYPRAESLETIRDGLEAGTALVLYEPILSVALVVTPKAARIVSLGDGKRIEETCAALISACREPGEAVGGVAEAGRNLVEPLALGPEVRRVLVSPQGRLAYVPFALLLSDREVCYVPSGTTLRRLRESPLAGGRGVLALGDPDYGEPADASAVYAKRGGAKLVPLPATRAEAEAVGDVVLFGEDATEAGLAEALARCPRWRAVHFACHGLVDAERPSLSSLALTPDPANDGFLTCLDVFRMRLPADLVVLSACETAKGRVYEAEGIVGLTSAFMTAGAPRVLCSLWKVDDAATKALMVRFYELWNPEEGEGLPAATALKRAQEFVRGHERWKHPYYWAAWVLWGLPD